VAALFLMINSGCSGRWCGFVVTLRPPCLLKCFNSGIAGFVKRSADCLARVARNRWDLGHYF